MSRIQPARRDSDAVARPVAPSGHEGHSHSFLFHAEGAKSRRWRLGILAAAMATVAVLELLGGLITGSLALLADAAHAATDSLALFLALIATHLVTRAAHSKKTFGYHRAEILAAFANAVVLAALGVFIVVEAIGRLVEPREIDGGLVTIFGALVLIVEVVGMAVLARVQKQSLNVRSAFLHLLGDFISTIAVIGTGLIIMFGGPGFFWTDPVVSILIALLLGFWAYRLIQESGHILMEGTPSEVDPEAVREFLESFDGVRSVHDLHVWTLTSGVHTMSAHIVTDHTRPRAEIAHMVRAQMASEFGLDHVTVQLEDPRHPCDAPHD